jgi:hypothetical protein
MLSRRATCTLIARRKVLAGMPDVIQTRPRNDDHLAAADARAVQSENDWTPHALPGIIRHADVPGH